MIAQTYTLPRFGAVERMSQAFFSPGARPLRFAVTGGLAGLSQLVLLKLFTDQGLHALLANSAAFLLAAQLNFTLSNIFTWRDRGVGQALWRRWLVFHGSIAGMAVVNMAVFAAARTAMPDLAASVTGICAAAIGNFFIGDRLVFRPRRSTNAEGADPFQDDAAAQVPRRYSQLAEPIGTQSRRSNDESSDGYPGKRPYVKNRAAARAGAHLGLPTGGLLDRGPGFQ